MWTKFLYRDPSPFLSSYGYAVIEDPSDNNNLVITGVLYRESINRSDMLLSKFSSDGVYLQTKAVNNTFFETRDHYGYSIVKAFDGYIVTGGVQGNLIGENALLSKFNNNGDFIWGYGIYTQNGNDPERAYSVIRTSDDGIAITGVTENDCFILKFDNSFNKDWAKRFDSFNSEGRSIIEAFNGDLVVTGGSGSILLTRRDFNNGNRIYANAYGYGSGFGYEIGYSVLEDDLQNLYVSGYSDSLGIGGDETLILKCISDGGTCLSYIHTNIPPDVDWNPEMYNYSLMNDYSTTLDDDPWNNPIITTPSLYITTVCTNCPPTAFIDSIIPNPQLINDPVYFYGHGVDEDGNIEEYEWTALVGGLPGLPIILSAEANFDTVFGDPGTYNIRFRVKDNDGYWSSYDEMNLVILDTCNCLYAGRCTEDMYLEWFNNDSTQITYTNSVLDGEGSNNSTDTIWFLTEVNIGSIPPDRITKSNRIVGYNAVEFSRLSHNRCTAREW